MKVKPFISPSENIREFSFRSLSVGIIFSFFFAIANTYLGLKIGQTISASIPAAVLSLGLSRAVLRGKTTVLEHNIIQSIATMGEGMAAGIVFALPALMLLGDTPSLFKVFLLALLGGVLGIVFMIPMRRFLIVEEHGKLPYPEGTACASILMASVRAGKSAIDAVYGFLVGGVYKILMDGFFLWNEIPTFVLRFLPKTEFSIDATPALVGIGHLIGFRICAALLCGGFFGWFVLIPMIGIFAGFGSDIVYPGKIPIDTMSIEDIWSNYIRYIGAGAVGTGGIIHLFKVIPLLGRALRDGLKELIHHRHHRSQSRVDQDISMKWLLIIALAVGVLLLAVPYFSFNLLSVIMLLILAVFFVAVSSIACGVVGSSSSPVSGMLITVMLITCCVYLTLGWTERIYLFSAITLSIVACVAIGLAGNTSQDLKAGFLLGATPWKQQLAQMIGLILPAIVVGFTVTVLNKTYVIGSTLMPAPQASLLAMIAEGVIEQTLPFGLVAIGIFLALMLALVGVPVMPFAIGLYLPFFLSAGIAVGGLTRLYADHKTKNSGNGTLFASGLVGGDALCGVVLAILTVAGIVPLSGVNLLPDICSLLFYLGLGALMCVFALRK